MIAVVIDVFARRTVGWRVSRTAHATSVPDAWEQALNDHALTGIVDWCTMTTWGSQYLSIRYTERLSAASATATATRWPTTNGLFKAEVIHRRGPQRSFEAVAFVTRRTRRLLESIGNIPPAEAEARYYAQAKLPALVA